MKWLPNGPERSVRSQLAIVLTLALIASLTVIVPALAAHDEGEFELDKNATNDLTVTAVGYLTSNINASTTSINVCETGAAPGSGDTILIRAERMTVSANVTGNFGGNCSGAKRTYTVARGSDGTVASSQSGGANNIGARVSLLEPETKDGPDWSSVHAAEQAADPDAACAALGLVACTYLSDGIGPSTFTIGSTKDHLPLSGWFHTSGASPDKAEILNAYAAKAIAEDGDQLLYFGMDRYAVDGSTDIGFWFFQDEVVADPDGTFSGTHMEGDLLILSTFTEGGSQSDIRVFQWVDSGGDEQENIASIDDPTLEYGDCVGDVGAADDGCATVNNTTIEAPWTSNYQFKGSSTGGWIPAGGFFEGGVNLTSAGLDGCFSSFLAETRSSPEITAILKDFALGAFEACDSDLTTQPRDGAGATIDDSDEDGLIDVQIGTGSNGVDVTDAATIVINGTSTWSGSLDFYVCGPIDAPGVCDTGGVLVDEDVAVDQDTSLPVISDAANLTEVGRYCWRAEFDSATEGVPDAIDSTLANECFEVLPVTPTLSTTAWSTGDATGSAVTSAQPFGTALFDKAVLSGTANQPGDNGGDGSGNYPSINATNGAAADGSITFTLIGPDDCSTVAAGTGTNPGTPVTVSGDGSYFSSGFTPDAPGEYYWQASYSGDSPNTEGKSHNDDCSDTNEDVTVLQLVPGITTEQSFVPNDAATITVASGAGDLAGTVVFKLYVNDSDCSEAPAYTSGSIDIVTDGTGTGLSRTVMSANMDAYSTTGTTFHWIVEYTSTNPAHTAITSPCGTEVSSITIDNDASS